MSIRYLDPRGPSSSRNPSSSTEGLLVADVLARGKVGAQGAAREAEGGMAPLLHLGWQVLRGAYKALVGVYSHPEVDKTWSM